MRLRERSLCVFGLLLLMALPAFADEPPDPALLEWLADQDKDVAHNADTQNSADKGTDTEAMLEWLAWWQTSDNATRQEDDNEQD